MVTIPCLGLFLLSGLILLCLKQFPEAGRTYVLWRSIIIRTYSTWYFFSSFKDGFHVPGKDVDDDGVAEGADDPEDEEEEAERMLNKRKTIYFS